MTGYLMNFTFYTLAMIGVILLGYVIVKKSIVGVGASSVKNKFLTVESILCLEPRKNMYVIKAGAERFLVSTNADNTQFITKLDPENVPDNEEFQNEKGLSLQNNFSMYSLKEKLSSIILTR